MRPDKHLTRPKQRALESARVISGSLDALGAQMDNWRSLYKDGGINPATDPCALESLWLI